MKGDKKGYKKGSWTEEEDRILMEHIRVHGKGRWNRVAEMTGLKRYGKSCRFRWINYLSPSIKHGDFSEEEDDLIIRLHNLLGNRWSLIAGRVPGRTDNQVKNHWNTHLSKKLGIKKQQQEARITNNKGAAAASSSRTLISPPMDDADSLKPPHSDGDIVGGEEGQKAKEEDIGTQSKFGFLEVVEEGELLPVVNSEWYESPAFWFSDSNYLTNPPSLVELLDQ